jgi:hypothetical protein
MRKTFLRIALCCLTGGLAYGSSIASVYDGAGSESTFGGILGWFFTPNINISVTSLGVYDIGAPGFAEPHDIGIFLTDGTSVVTATISAGLSGTLMSGSRFVPVSPTQLNAGTSYYIVANQFNTDGFSFGTGHVSYDPAIIWNGYGGGGGQDINGAFLDFGGQPGNLGPNFAFSAVPEPSSLLMFAGGCAMLLAARRRHSSARSGKRIIGDL